MQKHHYHVLSNNYFDGEPANNTIVTNPICRRRLKCYLRYLMRYKAEGFKFNFITVNRCDADGNITDMIRVVKTKKDIDYTY